FSGFATAAVCPPFPTRRSSDLGYAFQMPDAEIALPEIRECRAYRQYGALTVTGQADCVHGRAVIDHKTTGKVDLERYMGGYQWRSEEHTSELQSRENLVCRLLL